MLSLSIVQLAFAITTFAAQVGVLSVEDPRVHWLGIGIWCGTLFGLSVLIGVIASLKPSKNALITNLVFSILSIVFTASLLIISTMGIIYDHHSPCCSNSNYIHHHCRTCDIVEVSRAMYGTLIIVSLVQAIVALT